MNYRSLLFALGLLPLNLSSQTPTSPSAAVQRVSLPFAAVLGGKPFACGQTYDNVGLSHAKVTPADLRFFISHVELLDTSGNSTPLMLDQDGTFQYEDLALVDLEDGSGACRNGNPAMHTEVTGTVPSGKYTGVRFTLGVPFELDHVDPVSAQAPLNFTAMSWVWQSVFKFMRPETEVKAAATFPAARVNSGPTAQTPVSAKAKGMGRESAGFPVHLGSTGCVSSSPTTAPLTECAHPNRVVVTLGSFDVTKDKILFDLDQPLGGSDVLHNTPHTPPGCMSFPNDPDCAPIFHALGLAFNEAPAGEQVVFRTAPR